LGAGQTPFSLELSGQLLKTRVKLQELTIGLIQS